MIRSILATAAFVAFSTAASAAPVEWTLEDVSAFTPAGTFIPVTGSFIYDENALLGFSATIQGAAGTYSAGYDISGNGTNIVFTPDAVPDIFGYTGLLLVLDFTAPLTSTGGTAMLESYIVPQLNLDLRNSGSAECAGGVTPPTSNGICNAITSLSGNLTGSVVPVPAAAWLFGSALAGLSFLRRRFKTP